MPDTLHKTLIIRLSSVGDIVLSSLLIRVLRRRFPQAQIDFLVKSEFADLVRFNPHLSHVIEFRQNGTFRDLRILRRTIKAEGYDTIIDIHDSLRSRYLTTGRRRTVRLNKRRIARFLLVHCKIDTYRLFGGAPGVAERYLETARDCGVADDHQGLDLYFPDSTRNAAEEVLRKALPQNSAPCIGICPSARHNTKMWLKERFVEAATTLATELRASLLLFGSVAESERCRFIEQEIRRMAPGIHVVNLAGSLSLLETAAAMDRCSLVLTNDSGLMHIAAARKRKVVAIFGPTVRQLGFFPFGTQSIVVEHPNLNCRPCTHIGQTTCPRGHFKCMNEIPANRVIESARQLLAS